MMLMMAALWRVYRPGLDADSRELPAGRWVAMFWLALAASVLAKGPIGLLVAVGTIGLICAMPRRDDSDELARRDWSLVKRLGLWWGVPLVIVIVGAWVAMVVKQVGWSTYLAILNDEVVKRATVGSKEGHALPPGTHTVLLAALFWPGSLLTLAGMSRGMGLGMPRQRGADSAQPGVVKRAKSWFVRSAGRKPELFLLGWIVPAWIVFELVTSKLPHYTMPMFPAIAIVSARMVFAASSLLKRGQLSVSRMGNTVWWLIGFVPMLGLTVLAGLAVFAVGMATSVSRTLPIGGGIVLALAASGVIGLWLIGAALKQLNSLEKRTLGETPSATAKPVWAQTASVIAAAVVLSSAMQWILPAVAPGHLTAEVMADVAQVPGAARLPIASTYHEDSIVFWTRGRVERLSAGEISGFIARYPRCIVISRQGELVDNTSVTGSMVLYDAAAKRSRFDVWGPRPEASPAAAESTKPTLQQPNPSPLSETPTNQNK